ncbi:MAG: hypothetical protein QXL94_07010 [Candidatus Parvarchaeum sp.]
MDRGCSIDLSDTESDNMKQITELLQERKQRGYTIAKSNEQSIIQKDSV